jgi:hypothetical protein
MTKHAAALPLKPRVGGLTVFNPPALTDGINHQSFRLQWSDVEPTRGTYDWTTVNDALDSLPPGAYAKIGIQAGGHAPQWLRDLTGTVTVLNRKDQKYADCAHWWDTRMLNAWAHMQAACAAKFDADPRLLQVVACEATTVYMEPFIMGGDDASCIALYNAGLENQATGRTQMQAIATQLTAMLNAWKQTRIELPLHGTWEIPSASGSLNQPWPALRDFINFFARHGERICFSDYGLGPTDTAQDTTGLTLLTANSQYAWMQLRAATQGPTGYQITFGQLPHTPANFLATIKNAEDLGGSYLETASFGALTAAQRTASDAALKQIAGV